jgi:hypothetical protein
LLSPQAEPHDKTNMRLTRTFGRVLMREAYRLRATKTSFNDCFSPLPHLCDPHWASSVRRFPSSSYSVLLAPCSLRYTTCPREIV